jgi:rhomboid family GlyGly-CTERM serine protease
MPSPFILSTIIISILLILLQFMQSDLLFLRENIQQGEFWRIWTGNLIHSNYYHLALNLAGFWVFVLLFKDLMNLTQFLLSLTLLISGVGFGLYFLNPELYWYAGLSGALYGLFIIGAIYALIDKDYTTGLSILIIIPAKIIWDHTHNGGQENAGLIGVPVSTDSHIYGIVSAFLIGAFVLFRYWRLR